MGSTLMTARLQSSWCRGGTIVLLALVRGGRGGGPYLSGVLCFGVEDTCGDFEDKYPVGREPHPQSCDSSERNVEREGVPGLIAATTGTYEGT